MGFAGCEVLEIWKPHCSLGVALLAAHQQSPLSPWGSASSSVKPVDGNGSFQGHARLGSFTLSRPGGRTGKAAGHRAGAPSPLGGEGALQSCVSTRMTEFCLLSREQHLEDVQNQSRFSPPKGRLAEPGRLKQGTGRHSQGTGGRPGHDAGTCTGPGGGSEAGGRGREKPESRGQSGAANAVDGHSGWPGAAGAWRSQSLGSGNRREEWWVLLLSGHAARPSPAPPPASLRPPSRPRGAGSAAREWTLPPPPEPAACRLSGSPASPSP